MRKKNLKKIICPNFGCSHLSIFGAEIVRGKTFMSNLAHDEMFDDDDIKEGVIYNKSAGTAYLIKDFIAILLKDQDVDTINSLDDLKKISQTCSLEVKDVIQKTLARINESADTDESVWNKEEMSYYDSEVLTPEKRNDMVSSIKNEYLHHIFIERKKYILENTAFDNGSSVLEVGCGNARTIAHLIPLQSYNYPFVGIDISFARLQVAKAAMPDGDFMQASALNLPFKNGCFDNVIAFSSLHHLPSPLTGYKEIFRCAKTDGMLFINEPIIKPKLLSNPFLNWLKVLFETYEHSDHDNAINLLDFELFFNEANLKEMNRHYYGSALRSFMASKFFEKIGLTKYKFWWQFIIVLDDIFIKCFCRRVGVLGPGGVFISCKKDTKKSTHYVK